MSCLLFTYTLPVVIGRVNGPWTRDTTREHGPLTQAVFKGSVDRRHTDFRDVRIPNLTVSGSGDHIFSTDQHQNAHTDKIQQCRLCVQWWMKPEIEIGF